MPTLPIYALTIFEEDDSTPLFTVSTDPVATYPYLKAFDNFPEQEIDFARGSASIGQMNVQIVDVPQTPGDQNTGFITQRLGPAGYSAFNGRRVLATQDLGAGAETVLDGVIHGVALLDTYSTYQLELRDIRERERRCRAFETTDTPTVLPRGVLNGYGGTLILPTVPLTAVYERLNANEGYIEFFEQGRYLSEGLLTPAMREALLSVAPLAAQPEVYVYDRWKLLWRATAVGGAYTTITRVAHMHPSLIYPGTPLYNEQYLKPQLIYINNFVDAGTLPATSLEIDVILQYDGPVTKDWNLHLDGMTVGELLEELYDGDYSTEPPRVRYNSTALLALATPIRAKITKPASDLRDWAEKHAYPVAHAVPALNEDGEVAPVTYLLPPTGATLPDLNNANCAPDGAGWSHGTQDAVNAVKVEYIREYRLPPQGTSGLADADKIMERVVPVERRIQASIDLIGEQALEISGLLLRARGTSDGGPLSGDTVDELGQQVAQRVVYMATDRLALGGQHFRVKGMRTDTDVEAARAGSWFTASMSWMPDYGPGERGLSRLAQVVGRRNLNAAVCLLTLIDAGSTNAPLTAPTLGTVTAAATGVVSIPVTALGGGSEARVDYAINATEPAATSELWTFLPPRVTSVPTTLTTPPVPPGSTVWVRARGENIGRRPSVWTTAVSVAIGNTARVMNVSVVLDELGAPTLSWLRNTYAEGVLINYAVHAVGTVPGAGTNVQLDADDGSYAIPITVAADFHVTVTITPYTGWTGSAVSGTAGPAQQVRERGTAVYRAPVVSVAVAQSGSTGSLDLSIQDPDLRVTNVQFAEKVDAGAYGGLATTWDRSTGTAGTDATLTRGEDIPLADKHSVSVRYVVTYHDGAASRTIEGAHSFDSNNVAEITGCTITFDANGNADVSVQGDEDTANIYITVGDGTIPADPTSGTNDGTVAGRNGTIETSAKITTGNDAIVKVRGYNSTPTAGPVRTFRQGRRIGPFHKSGSTRSCSGTGETTLQTITVAANSMGSNGHLHLVAFFDVEQTYDDCIIRVKWGGATILTASLTSFLTPFLDMWIANLSATNSQRLVGAMHYDVTPFHTPVESSQAKDTTASVDLVITGERQDVGLADKVDLIYSMCEFMGTD